MPLRDDLLNPIAGENPSGPSVRYERFYDQIKEARVSEDDTLPAGQWERQAKRADYPLVIKLAGDALATRSKDLQLAAWLGEAHLRREGEALLPAVLQLFLDLQTAFWETIHPENDEGDLGLRAVPLQWAANTYAGIVYDFPLTKSGVTYLAYKAARAIGYEADATNNDARRAARTEAVKRGQITGEELDQAIASTPKTLYSTMYDTLGRARELLEELAVFCEDRYADEAPSFRKLRDSLDTVHNVVSSILNEKRRSEPDVVAAAPVVPEPEPPAAVAAPVAMAAAVAPQAAPVATPVPTPVAAAPVVTAPAAAAAPVPLQTGVPASWEDACSRIQSVAAWMHPQRPGSAVPFQLQTAICWGEVRRHYGVPPRDFRTAPTAQLRSALKAALNGEDWDTLLESSMAVLPTPPARCWLDLYRYLHTATSERGFEAFSTIIVSGLAELLLEYPDMPEWEFDDDTPVADKKTQTWIIATVLPAARSGANAAATDDEDDVEVEPDESPTATVTAKAPPPPAAVVLPVSQQSFAAAAPGDELDVAAEANRLAAHGSVGDAIALLMRDAAQQATGRIRFQRHLAAAELCLNAGGTHVALPILRELAGQIEARQLSTWEDRSLVSRTLALLLQSMNGDADAAERAALFQQLCQLDPIAAMALGA